MRPPIELRGQEFGYWLVIGPPEPRQYSHKRSYCYWVSCGLCGDEDYITRQTLLTGAGCCRRCAMQRWARQQAALSIA